MITTTSHANSLTTYNATAFSGSESVEVLERAKAAAFKMFNDACRKDPTLPANIIVPDNWKTLLTHWIIPHGEAYELWEREDIDKAEEYFNTLISRKKQLSTSYDPTWRDYLCKLSSPRGMDHQNRLMREFHTNFWKDKLSELVLAELARTVNFGDILNNEMFIKGAGLEIKNDLIENKRIQLNAVAKNLQDIYVEHAMRNNLQGLVAADPQLFKYFDNAQVPLTASSKELTEWVRSKILYGKPEGPWNIQLRTNTGIVSPLTKAPVFALPATTVPRANPTPPPINHAQQQQPQGQPQPPRGGNRGGRSQRGGRAQNFFEDGEINQQQPQPATIPQKKKHCAYCRKSFPKSKVFETHNQDTCFRVPGTPNFDAVKARTPPRDKSYYASKK